MSVTTDTGFTADGQGSYVEWGSVAAGAVAGLALSFVLLTFGAATGLSAVSPWTSSAAVTAVAVGSAFWVLLVALWSFALGGYLAARMRHRWPGADSEEIAFRDRAHGLLSWALAIVIAAVVATAGASRNVGANAGSGITASNTAVDTIVRTPRAEIAAASDAQRAEVGRVLAANLASADLAAADKQYLASIVSNRTGVATPEAERTVGEAFSKFKEQANRARKAGVVMAFIAAASLMVGAAIAWWAAGLGGEHRDKGTVWEAFRRHSTLVIVRKVP